MLLSKRKITASLPHRTYHLPAARCGRRYIHAHRKDGNRRKPQIQLEKSLLINGQIFDEDYFEHLIAEIQEIRASERRFYQKITDIYGNIFTALVVGAGSALDWHTSVP